MRSVELHTRQIAIQEKMNQRADELGYEYNEIAPIYDGVIDVDGYLKSKPKIMWVMKEPYDEITDSGIPKGGGWKIDFTLDLPMFATMAKIVYGIVNEKYYDEIPEKGEVLLKLLQTTAYINLSKMPALTKSNEIELKKKFADWKDIIIEQIDIYNPDVVIFGNTYKFFKEGDLGEDPCQDSLDSASNYGITAVQKTRSGRILIDTYHPSPMRKCGNSELTDEKYINSIVKGVIAATRS